MVLDEQQWQRFSLDGYLHLGRVLTGPELEALRARADELASGTPVMAAAGDGEAEGGLAAAGAAVGEGPEDAAASPQLSPAFCSSRHCSSLRWSAPFPVQRRHPR